MFQRRSIRLAIAATVLLVVGALAALARYSAPDPVRPALSLDGSDAFVLDEDVETTGERGIVIRGGDVSLDMNGKTVSCASVDERGGYSVGIQVRATGAVEIYNGAVRGCVVGIRASEAASLAVSAVDLSRTRYMGIDAIIDRLSVTGVKFAHIGGYDREAYAVGLNVACGESCVVEQNAFADIYPQAGAPAALPGDGVGIIVRSGSSGVRITGNSFANSKPVQNTIAVWVAENAAARVASNLVVGIERGIVGYGAIHAERNVLWLPDEIGDSWGLFGGVGSEYSENLVVGFEYPRGMQPTAPSR